MSANLTTFSKALKYTGNTFDVYDVSVVIVDAIRTDNWRPVFLKLEQLAIGRGAVVMAAFAFSAITGTAIGVLGYALLMAIVGAAINDTLIDEINNFIGF